MNTTSSIPQTESSTRLVPLPEAPINTSPVPWLTSIHSETKRGPYGNSQYRGNCGGYLIHDLLNYFKPNRVLDPMSGSGTCSDVCTELGIECTSLDIKDGADACDPSSYTNMGTFDFIWAHPPYWKMIRYNNDPRCLSNADTLNEFLERMRSFIQAGTSVLAEDGKLAILIGGYSQRGMYMPLAALITQIAIEEGLWPACTEIIRFQHGNTSSNKVYSSSFIPGLHDTCMVFRRLR